MSVARACFLLLPLLPGACAGSYRADDTTRVTLPAEDVLRLRWHRKLSYPGVFDFRPQEFASAAFGPQGQVFAGSNDGRFVALTSRGRLLWSVRVHGSVSSQPRYHAETNAVYFGADDGMLYAIDADSGKRRWSYATQGTINHAPVFSAGLILFTSSEDRVYALDAATGRWRWQYGREPPEGFTIFGYSGVTADNGVAYCGFSDGMLVALRIATGAVVWTRSLSGGETRFIDVGATPLLVGGQLITASFASGVYSLSPDSGAILWHFPVEGASRLSATPTRLYFTAPRVGLVALDHQGRQLWRQAMPQGVPSSPTTLGRYVLVAGTESGLVVAEGTSGELLQYFDPGNGISAAPAVSASRVATVSNTGRLFVFDVRHPQ